MFSANIFRANDIRGQWNKDFDLLFTKNLALALIELCKKKNISSPDFLIGQDARLSSPALSQALISHLKNFGAGVCDIGLAPSPLCYFLLHHYNLTACIVITASHNPVEDNGFKILFHRKYKIFFPIPFLKKLCVQKSPPKKVSLKKGYLFSVEKEEPYLASLKKEFSLKPIPFALDTGNGALGPLAKKVFSALGLKPWHLFEEPDGSFPHHHPDPTLEKNLIPLKKKVKATKSLFGFGFDGDGDRLVLVTKSGKTVLGDELGAVFLQSLWQKENRSNLILADVKCADWFFQSAQKLGLKSLITKSGHGLIRAKLEKTKALMALEFSGHIFFNDKKERGFDDALYAGLRLLKLLSEKNTSLEALLPKMDSLRSPEIRVPMPLSEVVKKISQVQIYLKKRKEPFKSLDGIRLSREDSWALFRSSKTQSALSMRFEAPDKKSLKKLKAEFSKVMGFQIPKS